MLGFLLGGVGFRWLRLDVLETNISMKKFAPSFELTTPIYSLKLLIRSYGGRFLSSSSVS